jgi:hypothetical protein
LFKDFGGAYSSGSVQDLHLIPFSSLSADADKETPKPTAKIEKKCKEIWQRGAKVVGKHLLAILSWLFKLCEQKAL